MDKSDCPKKSQTGNLSPLSDPQKQSNLLQAAVQIQSDIVLRVFVVVLCLTEHLENGGD